MKIYGNIIDSDSGLGGATIVLQRDNQNTNVWATTSDDGYFQIENEKIEPDDIFEIRFLGFKTQLKKASDLQNAKILMVEDAEELDEVLLTSNIGEKPKKINALKKEKIWYNKPVFLIPILGLTTIGLIMYIVKKTK